MKIRLLTLLLATLAGTHSSGAAAKPEPHPGARAFLAELAAETGADRVQKQQWRTLLAEAKYQFASCGRCVASPRGGQRAR